MQPVNDIPAGRAPVLDSRGPDPRTPLTAAEPVDLVADGTHAVARLSGEIDVANSAAIHERVSLAVADPRIETVVLDLSGVTFFDSTGLSALIQLRNQASSADKHLSLRGVTPPVMRVLALTHLDEVFGLDVDDPGRC